MKKPIVDIARSLIRRRKFGKAIVLLENERELYRESFDYYILLGVACLYAGDVGNANYYYQQARHIKVSDTNLLLGQAVIFLQRGDTDRAIEYYLEVLDRHPENKTAKSAMEFIRTQGNYENIIRWVDTGRIVKFYPPIGLNLSEVLKVSFSAILGILVAIFLIFSINGFKIKNKPQRFDISELLLTTEEKKNPLKVDLSGGVYQYLLTDMQITDSYEKARKSLLDYRDNLVRIEVNRIVNSNAIDSIKKKALLLASYLEKPTFDTVTDNFTYKEVSSEPKLYNECWVVWSGRISNAVLDGDSFYCDLLVGYEDLKNVEGIVPLIFLQKPNPAIDGSRSIKVLGRISIKDDKLVLVGEAVYQPLLKK